MKQMPGNPDTSFTEAVPTGHETGENDTRYLTADIPVFLIRCLTATMKDLAISTSRLTTGLGLSIEDLTDPYCRVSFRQGREFIRRALDMAEDRALGLETGSRERITSIGLVGFAMITSNTLGDAIELGLRLQKETGSMLEFDARSEDGAFVVSANSRFHDPDIHVFLVEEAFSSFMQLALDLIGDTFAPLRVDLTYPEPIYSGLRYTEIFGCDIRFGQSENAFVYDLAWHQTPLLTADPLAHKQVLGYLQETGMRAREMMELVETVERIIRQNLSDAPKFSAVAKALHMSDRTLRRRLGELDVTYQSLLDRQKRLRALELLRNPVWSLDQVAQEAGFSDPQNFRRAFRRWTGKTPAQARREIMER